LPTIIVGFIVGCRRCDIQRRKLMAEPGPVVVVGAASGIGAHVLERFSARGATVIALDIVKPASPRPAFIECDLRDASSIGAAVAALPDGIAAIAHVAGIPGTRPAPDVLAVNFLGLRQFLELAVPKVRPHGAVTVVASTAGALWRQRLADLEPLLATRSIADGLSWLNDSQADYPVYNLSKEATIAFVTRWSGAAWRDQRARLNTVSPGPVETPILGDFEQSMGKELLDGVRATVGRHATTADIAPVVEAVCGPDFGWMVGQDVQLDGGFTAAMLSGGLTFPAG
jgi:NAD(P)-dependent dehydrogenase (short-subunit alcohol dehydrogenase family)